jgi:hypothetical protein
LSSCHDIGRKAAAQSSLPELIVTKAAIARVLTALQDHKTSPSMVQKWASFVRRGYFGSVDGKRHPIDIRYDRASEDEIVEIVGRLDELGDSIDGDISEAELVTIMAKLGRAVS